MQRSKAGTQGRGVKMKPGQPTAKNLPDKAPTQKPFAGRVFYLDIASRLVAEKLEKDIKELGGTVEGFLSKEISFLITNKKEAKCTKSLRYQCSLPSPEPASGSSSARPSAYRGDVQDGGSSKKPEKEDVSRGKSLLKKVIKEQEILPRNSILANALNWGVRVLHLDEAKIYIDQKKRSLQHGKQPEQADAPTKPVAKRPPRRKVKAQKLKSPFIKVEDSSCQYKPLYLVLPLFRSFQSPVSKHCRPADKKPAAAQKATETKQNLNKTWHGQEEGNLSHNKLKEQKKRGYCECCLQKYDDLEAHLLSPQHKNYAQGSYYQDVDNLITLFEFDFVDWSKFRHETQGSGLFIPGAVKQEEKEFPPRIDHVSTNPFSVHNPESGVVQVTESAKPPAAACSLVHNLVCYSEPMFTTPCPPQSMCSVTCVTDSFSKPLSSQVITPTHENVSSAQIAEPPNISPDHNEGAPKDLSPKDGDFKALIEVERSETADNDQHCVAQPANCCPSKRLKLDDSLVEGNGVSAAPPPVQTGPSKDLEKSGPLGQSDACCHLPQSSSPSKLHRKVKQLERKKSEELPCKVSVPLEDCDISVSKERLEWLFQSSDLQTEFLGFSCCSAEDLKCTEDMKEQALHRHDLWSLISNTDSSASTFNGF